MSTRTPELLLDLRERMRSLEQAHRPAPATGRPTRTPIDQLFPDGGLPPGSLVEWLAPGPGAGSLFLALAVAASLRPAEGKVIVLDGDGTFYPPAAERLGVPLDSLVVVRPGDRREHLWTLEQCLRTSAIVFARPTRLGDRDFRRLQLASEAGGGVGFLFRPAEAKKEPSWASVRLFVEPQTARAPDFAWRFKVEAFRTRTGVGRSVELELDDESHDVSLVPALADPTPSRRESAQWQTTPGPVFAFTGG